MRFSGTSNSTIVLSTRMVYRQQLQESSDYLGLFVCYKLGVLSTSCSWNKRVYTWCCDAHDCGRCIESDRFLAETFSRVPFLCTAFLEYFVDLSQTNLEGLLMKLETNKLHSKFLNTNCREDWSNVLSISILWVVGKRFAHW